MVKVFNNSLLNILPGGTVKTDGTTLVFKQEDNALKYFEINESIARIRSQYEDVKTGKSKAIYCSYGIMENVNITFSEKTVELFDSTYIISFNRLDFERMIETA